VTIDEGLMAEFAFAIGKVDDKVGAAQQ